jgi:hypothetical protein
MKIIIQLLPALKVNIIIVHPRGVVFPRALALILVCKNGYISGQTWNIT